MRRFNRTEISTLLTLSQSLFLIQACTARIGSSEEPGSHESGLNVSGSNKKEDVLEAKMNTIFKSSTDSSSSISTENVADGSASTSFKCNVDKGTKIKALVLSIRDNHALISISNKNELPECKNSKGYVFVDHFTGFPESMLNSPTQAVLSTIAFAEGTNDRYDLIFSFQVFTSFADHPRRVVCSSGLCSSAAGRYQFLETSWDETRAAANLKNFSPESQDAAALYRIQFFRGVSEHANVLGRAAFERMIFKLNNEWASLPGSPFGQPTKSMNSLWQHYVAQL